MSDDRRSCAASVGASTSVTSIRVKLLDQHDVVELTDYSETKGADFLRNNKAAVGRECPFFIACKDGKLTRVSVATIRCATSST